MTLELRKKIILIFLATAIVLLLWPYFGNLGRSARPYDESRLMMDTVITIKAYPEDSGKAVDKAFAVFAEVEAMASFHKPDSELTRLNETLSLPTTSSASELLHLCTDYHYFTRGYFDPSFARLQKAYGFYDNAGCLPDEEEISRLLATNCGLEKVLSCDEQTIKLASGSLLDLGGIAGGYAIEKAKVVLRETGCQAFLIDDAGDIWFEGQKPDGKPWRIAVRDPRDNGALAIVESREPIAISTSGDYERFITVNGKRYGHIMNPHTGHPVDYYKSVTIVANSAVAADALSTAVFAMPPEKAFAWVEEYAVAALFLTASDTIHLSSCGRQFFSEIKPE